MYAMHVARGGIRDVREFGGRVGGGEERVSVVVHPCL